MLFVNILLILLTSDSILGIDEITINMSIDYFNHRDVKFICLLACDSNSWILKLSKNASKQSIALSKVNVKDYYDKSKLIACFLQRFISIGVMIDSKCENYIELLYFASKNSYFDSMHKWLIINENSYKCYENNKNKYSDTFLTNNTIVEVLDNLNISIDSDIILADRKESSEFELSEVHNFGKIQGGNTSIKKLGVWSSSTGLDLNMAGYKYYRRWNFQQWPMRIIIVVSSSSKTFDPSIFKDTKPSPGVITITKASAVILHVIAEIHNFRFIYSFSDRWIGHFGKNSSNAASNALYLKEQDVTPIIRFLKTIYEKIDIIHSPLTSIETRYYYRIPTSGPGKFENQFLRPLSNGAWWCVVAMTSLCGALLLVSAKFEHRPSSTQYAIFSVIATVCQQFFQDTDDSESRRISTARKVTILVTGLSCVLLYNYYTSSVVSWLLSGPPPSINSLRELLESPLELIYEDIGYTRSWLQTPSYYYNKRNMIIEDELRQKKVFNKKPGAPLLIPIEKGIAMVKAGGYAYHTESNTANELISSSFTQSELCELGSLQSMEKTLLHTAVQKNSPYKEFLVWSLMRLTERGIVSCIQHRTSTEEVTCEGSSPRALALGGAAPAFLLLAGGYLLATFIMMLEMYHKKLSIRYQRSIN